MDDLVELVATALHDDRCPGVSGCNWCEGYSAEPHLRNADTAIGTVLLFLLERDIAEFMDDAEEDIELFREKHHW